MHLHHRRGYPFSSLGGPALAALIVALCAPQVPAAAATFNWGDVFAAVSTGEYQHYDGAGVLQETLDMGTYGFTTGMAFDSTGNFYGTNFTYDRVSKFTGPLHLMQVRSWRLSSQPQKVHGRCGSTFLR